MVTVGQDVFVVLFLCAWGEAGPGSAKNIWSTQRPLALHPSQDPTRLLPLARARSLLGGGGGLLACMGSCKGKQNECSQVVDVV